LNPSPIANWAGAHTLWELGGGPAGLATFAMDFDVPYSMELYVNPAQNSYYFPTGVKQDTWYQVAGSYDGSKTHAFINGVEIGTGFAPSGPLMTPANGSLLVATSIERFSFTGSIDEVRIWNIARTQAQIARDMSVRLVGNEPGLVGYYRFDEASGGVVLDATGRGNNGSIVGGAKYGPSGVNLGCR
jgi:hypothetical protein